jgi:hypothetical protein
MTRDTDTDTNTFFEIDYEQEYVLVDDNLGNRFTVPLEELWEVRPDFKNQYIRVHYYGRAYWLDNNFYFP